MANIPEFISIVRRIRDVIYPDVVKKQGEAADSATSASENASTSKISMWESIASKMTANSLANESEDVVVKTYTSNGDGTFTATDTAEYSAKHHELKANNAGSELTFTNKTMDDISNFVHANAIHFKIVCATDLEAGDIIERVSYDSSTKTIRVQKRNSLTSVAIGIVKYSLPAEVTGLAIKDGFVTDIDTSIYNEGDILYPDTAGGLTSIRQEGISQPFAVVFKVGLKDGALFVLVQQPLELPIQTGKANKYLKTDGEKVTWSDVISSSGQGLSYFLGDVLDTAGNYDLTTFPSPGDEVEVQQTANDTKTAFCMQRYITESLGGSLINGGLWTFNTYASVDSDVGISEIIVRMNKSVLKVGTITSSGDGNTRTFTASEAGTFVTEDANDDILLASMIQTDNGTFQITSFTSDVEVEATSSDAGYENETDTAFSVFYKMFDITTGEITGDTPFLYDVQTVQPEFVINKEDRVVASYFAKTDTSGDKVISLYKGGTENFTNIVTPLVYRHNALSGLNEGDYKHLTENEKTMLAGGTSSADTLHTHTTSGIESVNEQVILGRSLAGVGTVEQLVNLPTTVFNNVKAELESFFAKLDGNNTIAFKIADGINADEAVSKGQLDASSADTKLATDGLSIVKTDASAIKNQCTAWVNFDGADGTIRDSYNVSSVVRNDTGLYSIAFNEDMYDTNFSICITIGITDDTGSCRAGSVDNVDTASFSVSGFDVKVQDVNSAGNQDDSIVAIQVFGGKA